MSNNITKKFLKNHFEKKSWQESLYSCGIDEVGRGCLAGPLVTCALILPQKARHPLLKDSKTLTEQEREKAYQWITKNCYHSLAFASHKQIDKLNIYQATLLTMQKSLLQLLQSIPFSTKMVKYVLIDSMPLHVNVEKTIQFYYFDKGETHSTTIAAASIVAKVTRDRLMKKIAPIFPKFDLQKHKGYGTSKHWKALDNYNSSIIHRKTFIRKTMDSIKNEKNKQQLLF